jgi:hypothetical protein
MRSTVDRAATRGAASVSNALRPGGAPLGRDYDRPDSKRTRGALLSSSMPFFEVNGTRIFAPPTAGPPLHTEADAVDLITASLEHGASCVALPVARFDPAFFDLHTRSLGEFIQKFVIYKRRVAFVGDISPYLVASTSLRAFVREANEGDHVWFVANFDELAARIAAPAGDEPVDH